MSSKKPVQTNTLFKYFSSPKTPKNYPGTALQSKEDSQNDTPIKGSLVNKDVSKEGKCILYLKLHMSLISLH